MSISDEFPLVEDSPKISAKIPEKAPAPEQDVKRAGTLRLIWAQLTDFGLAEPVLRVGMHMLAIMLVVAVVWGMRNFYLKAQTSPLALAQKSALAAPLEAEADRPAAQATPTENQPQLPGFSAPVGAFAGGIPRLALLHTTIPSRPRVEVILYTVKEGDTVFGIAEQFGLKPETIFWGNWEVLNDNPHNLIAGQVLNILPVDGTYHRWSAGENFGKVAKFYGVDPQVIVAYAGNRLDEYSFDIDTPNLEAGTWLIVPGGKREFVDWGPPRIPRDNPAVARTYGPGFCGLVTDGAVGTGTFIWPTTATYLSGYDYNPGANHSGIDIAGPAGNPVFAVDAGVVVYAGWSNYGYGNLVVIDHGNGWQSLYAHLSAVNVFCGQSLFQGSGIGAVGNTGNSSGAHLHFELMYSTAKVNPWNYLSP